MLSQRSYLEVADGDLEVADGADEIAEWEAETFASMLLARLRVFTSRGAGVSVLRYDEALG